MILELLLRTIAATTSTPVPPAPPPRPVIVASAIAAGAPHLPAVCRNEYGMTSLVGRTRICHTAAEWRAIDARRAARRRQGR